MSAPEAEGTPQEHKSAPNTHYQRLVARVTKGTWRIEDEHGRRNLTEQDILARLKAAGISPDQITRGNYPQAFRIATQYLGRGPSHCSGKTSGDLEEGRRRTISTRKGGRHRSRPRNP